MSDAINIEDTSIPLPITQVAIQSGRRFAGEQPTDGKKNQVYLNTLAVCVVKNYMDRIEIPTHLTASDSWNPAMRLGANVADLKLYGLGHLECRPVPDPNSPCYVPLDVPDDRIGVVVVHIDLESLQATLLGFSKNVKPGELPPSQWQTIDDLPEYIEELSKQPASLGEWLHDVFSASWESIEALANTIDYPEKKLASRGQLPITRIKQIYVGNPLQQVAIAVTLTPVKNSDTFDINLEVLPIKGQTYLPEGLQLQIVDRSGEAFFTAKSGKSHKWMETKPFGREPGEAFSAIISLNEDEVTQEFVI